MKHYRVYSTEQIMTAKTGLVLAAALIACTAVWIYFSPFQTCLREVRTDQYRLCMALAEGTYPLISIDPMAET